jgi:Amt family ammonium transporter
VNKGDTAWMLSATIFVLLMTIPGLALFYGGLVRTKNMLSVLMWVFYSVCIVTILWVVVGYSLAFSGGSTALSAASPRPSSAGVHADSKAATFSVGANIPELVYVCFQMTFAAITPALIVGSLVERMKFSSMALFLPLWLLLGLLPDRPHGLVLGRPGRDRRRRQSACGRGRRCRKDRRTSQAR